MMRKGNTCAGDGLVDPDSGERRGNRSTDRGKEIGEGRRRGSVGSLQQAPQRFSYSSVFSNGREEEAEEEEEGDREK